MRVVWITRSFLDYRIPVYNELNKLLKGNFLLVYNSEYIPKRVDSKVKEVLKENAIGLKGELKIGPDDFGDFLANKKVRVPFQPKLISKVKSFKPDIIISDGFFQWTYAALWIRTFSKIPHVMCYERTKHTERNAQWYRTLYRKVVSKWIDSYCASGELCGDYLKQLGVSKNKITFGHMVADLSGISQSNEPECKTDVVTYLYVGKLIERKGISQLMEAWHSFQKDKKEKVILKIIGNGELLDYIKSFIKYKNLSNIKLTGYVDYDQMYKVYNLADVFLMPTLEDNWSLVVPEAMANNLPILCSEYNGCWPEYVTKENGWVFNPLNKDDFQNKLEESYKTTNLKAMGKNSKIIINNHTPLHAANAILEAIKLADKQLK